MPSRRARRSKPRSRARNRGQAIVEYILLLSIVLVASSGLFRSIQSFFDRGVPFLGARMESTLKSGRTPTGLWTEDEAR